jgi:hypothetical protein
MGLDRGDRLTGPAHIVYFADTRTGIFGIAIVLGLRTTGSCFVAGARCQRSACQTAARRGPSTGAVVSSVPYGTALIRDAGGGPIKPQQNVGLVCFFLVFSSHCAPIIPRWSSLDETTRKYPS